MTTGFDETLRKYGWFEDVDGSFSVMRQGKVVTARQARIYHHRAAEKRANGHRMGLWAILNRGYVVMKHVHANPQVFTDPTREAARLRRYCRARALAYRVMARDAFGRDRARGAAEALTGLEALVTAAPGALKAVYQKLEQD